MSERKKQRGQKRRLKKLFECIDRFEPYTHCNDVYEHFHVPIAFFIDHTNFIDSAETNSKIKTAFIRKWILTAERFIQEKPKTYPFCRVVSLICYPELSRSQIIIFYDEKYYSSFFDRNDDYQQWMPIKNRSLKYDRKIETKLIEKGYYEIIKDKDDIFRSTLWFYGEIGF